MYSEFLQLFIFLKTAAWYIWKQERTKTLKLGGPENQNSELKDTKKRSVELQSLMITLCGFITTSERLYLFYIKGKNIYKAFLFESLHLHIQLCSLELFHQCFGGHCLCRPAFLWMDYILPRSEKKAEK